MQYFPTAAPQQPYQVHKSNERQQHHDGDDTAARVGPRRLHVARAAVRVRVLRRRRRAGRGGLEDLCTALSDTSFTASSPGEEIDCISKNPSYMYRYMPLTISRAT